jgi:hypothetical protein
MHERYITLIIETPATGGKKTKAVVRVNGITDIIRKNLLLPNRDRDLSEAEAMRGSEIASIILPANIMKPIVGIM